ncbi:MAG: hypothetical protein ACTJG2_00830 [Candidatus Saccharimonadales bacterium]
MSTNQPERHPSNIADECRIVNENLDKIDKRLDITEQILDRAEKIIAARTKAERDQLEAEIRELTTERDTYHAQLTAGEDAARRQPRYQRPNGYIVGLFSKMLAPLPNGMIDTKIDEKAEQTMKSLPAYWLTAILTLFGVIGSIIGLALVVPWLFVSPLSLVMSGASLENDTQSTVMMVIMCVIVVAAVSILVRVRSFLYQAAHNEEKWFRSGAEQWTMRQRITSCFAFGTCHLINIIYPVATCLILSLVGAVFMATYLREYRRSHDTYRATMASTKLHARYNICAFSLLVAMFMLSLLFAAM